MEISPWEEFGSYCADTDVPNVIPVTKTVAPAGPPVDFAVTLEREVFQPEVAHNLWAMFTLNATDQYFENRINVDFVVVIDISASMKKQQKLAGVLASLEYMIERLQEGDRLALVQFNDYAQILADLSPMTSENKLRLLSTLHTIQASGNTNISDGLFTGLNILESRPIREQQRISRLLLLTDGLTNRGFTQGSIIETLKQKELNESLTIHTFGYGSDHSSAVLQAIAFCSSGGLYYFVDGVDTIGQTFGECLAGTLSTVATNIRVRLEAFDGCRFIQFRTKFPVKSFKLMKDYEISLGSMYSNESRSVLMRLSLRQLTQQQREHPLFRITLSYITTVEQVSAVVGSSSPSVGKMYSAQKLVSVYRRAETPLDREIPLILDQQINRILSAEAIEQAIGLVLAENFAGAQEMLAQAIRRIEQSRSAQEPYCRDLIQDLTDCAQGILLDSVDLATGIHEAHVYSTMYYQERSAGRTKRRKQQMHLRSSKYGYVTPLQQQEMARADEATSRYRSDYVQFCDAA